MANKPPLLKLHYVLCEEYRGHSKIIYEVRGHNLIAVAYTFGHDYGKENEQFIPTTKQTQSMGIPVAVWPQIKADYLNEFSIWGGRIMEFYR